MDDRNLKLINKAFDKINSNYKGHWEEYERMYDSRHTQEFLDAAKEQERNAVFIPLTYSTINIAESVFESAFFSQGNPVEITNVGENDLQKRDELTRICDYFYRKSKPYQELSRAFLSAAIFGVGAAKLFWDVDAPVTEMIPPTEIGFDVDAISRQDTKYLAHRFTQTLQEIKEKFESGFYACETHKQTQLLDAAEHDPYARKTIKELYAKKGKGFEVTTYSDDVKIRTSDFKRNPIKHGYMLHRLPAIDAATRENQVAAIGDSLVRVIKPLNEELNIKRNQRMDLIEKHINPEVYVPVACGLDPDDALKNGGIKNCDQTAGILFAPVTGASEFVNDVQMLKNDIEDASSINGIMRGNTSASDRRSSTALATVNANSSIRLESMIKLINETLFEDWARDFVRLCYINAADDLILKILEQETHSLGPKGMRPELDIDIKVNFGVSINKEAKIQDLIMVVQMISEMEGTEKRGLLKQIITLILGEEVDTDAILGIPAIAGDGAALEGDGGARTQAPSADVLGDNAPGGMGEDVRVAGDEVRRQVDQIRSNQI